MPNARLINVLLGVWLFISAFLWPHTYEQMTNTWILGVLCVVFALIAMRVPQARYLNTALAVWLFISAFALPGATRGPRCNNILGASASCVGARAPRGARPGYVTGGPTPPPRP